MKKYLLRTIFFMSSLCTLTVLTAIFSGVLFAGNSAGQSIRDVKVSLEFDRTSLPGVFSRIEEITEFRFQGDPQVDRLTDRISLKVEKRSVAFVLEKIAGQTGLAFKQLDARTIVVRLPSPAKPENNQSAPAPDRIITGKVIDANGIALSGASVLVKGTNIGAVADIEGNYVLSVPDEATTLVFSFIGYLQEEVDIAGRAVIDITLNPDITALEEVVVSTGYWEVDQKLSTGSVSQITAKEIEQQPISNPLQALQGTMAGVNVEQRTGLPGGGFNIAIRGRNSLREEGNAPLIIVDGVPFPSNPLTTLQLTGLKNGASPLASINPNDIEKIEVLKDADATAIYGSRGANGVVLITTKKGLPSEKVKLDLNYSYGMGQARERMDLLNSGQHVALRREGILNAGLADRPLELLERALPDAYVWDSTRFTDWQDVLIGGTAEQTNASLTLSGGSAHTNFTFGGNYFKETTVFPGNNDFQRLSGNFGLNHASIDGRLQATISTNYSSSTSTLPFSDLTQRALALPPNAPELFDEEGNLNWENGTWENPLAELQRRFEDRTDNFIANASFNYEVIPNLRLKANLGYNTIIFTSNRTLPIAAINPAEITPNTTASTSFHDGATTTWLVEPQIEYSKSILNGDLSVLIGGTFQNTNAETEYSTATGFTSDAFLLNKQAADQINVSDATFSQYRYNAVFARFNYNWRGKYVLNLTGRRDGSSRFGPGRQFGNFGAVGAAWIFSEESFIPKTFLSFGKLRASYGSTGSDQVSDYQFLDTYTFTQFPYNDITGLEITRLANPSFSWETTRKLEFGVELGLLQNRISTNITWYRNRTTDQLLPRPLSLVTGGSSLTFNLPATVENRGWEFTISTINVRTNAFSWTTDFNLTIPENKLLEFDNIESFPQFDSRWEVGQPIIARSEKRFQFNGINPETGLFEFEDFNQDGNISLADALSFMELGQEYFGGVRNSLTYKSIQLSFHFQYVKQTGFSILRFWPNPGTQPVNQPVAILDRWQQPGDVSDFQQVRFNGTTRRSHTFFVNSDQMRANTSFIRLRNVSLSYTLPSGVISRLKVSNLRVFFEAQNVVTFTEFDGLNPENSGSNQLPPLQIFTGGLQLTL